MTTADLKEIASQLKHPQGTKGIEIANMMNETNINMTLHSISNLNISDSDKILEIGHGNCGHLKHLLAQHNNLTYYGLETSNLMHQEAQKINSIFTEKKQASFSLYDGLNIPFPENYFDKAFTVNTIYFWTNPEFLLSELYRVIKKRGIMSITFAHESFMERLPFTKFGFDLYSISKIEKLIHATPFKIIHSDTETEQVKSKTGELMDRTFTTVTIEK